MIAPFWMNWPRNTTARIKIGKVNIDEQQEIAAQYGIRAIPTLLLFQQGQVAEQMVGLRSKRDLKASFEQVAA